MMNTREDKGKKRVWEKPVLKTVQLKETAGGGTFITGETIGYES